MRMPIDEPHWHAPGPAPLRLKPPVALLAVLLLPLALGLTPFLLLGLALGLDPALKAHAVLPLALASAALALPLAHLAAIGLAGGTGACGRLLFGSARPE